MSKHKAKDAPKKRTDLKCAECGSWMVLRDSRFGLFYGCIDFPRCRGTHGAHADGSPFGTPAGPETRKARARAHAEFDRLWKNGNFTRKQAYAWMRRHLGLARDQAHIGKLTREQCDALIWIVREKFGEITSDVCEQTETEGVVGCPEDGVRQVMDHPSPQWTVHKRAVEAHLTTGRHELLGGVVDEDKE